MALFSAEEPLRMTQNEELMNGGMFMRGVRIPAQVAFKLVIVQNVK